MSFESLKVHSLTSVLLLGAAYLMCHGQFRRFAFFQPHFGTKSKCFYQHEAKSVDALKAVSTDLVLKTLCLSEQYPAMAFCIVNTVPLLLVHEQRKLHAITCNMIMR